MLWPFIHKTSERLQIDPVECGAVSLGIILEWWGQEYSNAQLKELMKISQAGSDAKAIIDAAQALGLSGHAQRLTVMDLTTIKRPAILFVDNCHFVVYEGHFLGRFYINDPMRGRYSLDRRELQTRFSHIALLWNEGPKGLAKKGRKPLKFDAIKFVFASAGLAFGMLFAVFAQVLGYFLIHDQADRAIARSLCCFLLLLIASGLFFVWTLMQVMANKARLLSKDEGAGLRESLLSLPLSFFYDRPFSSYRTVFIDTMLRSWGEAKKDLYYFFVATCIVIAFFIAILSPLVLLAVIFSTALFLLQGGIKRSLHHDKNKALAHENQQRSFYKAWEQKNDLGAMGQAKLLEEALMAKSMDLWALLPETLYGRSLLSPHWPVSIFLFLFVWFLSWDWHHGQISLREISSLLILAFAFAFFLAAAVRRNPASELAQSLKKDIAFHQEQLIPESFLTATDPLVQIKDLSLVLGQEKLIKNFNLSIRRGEIIGVVAASSAFLRLMGQRIKPGRGEILRAKACRIALIDDESDLFLGSLKDNLTLLDESLSEEQIVSALSKAFATELFHNRPLGLLSPILAHGANLSQGQKKRLLLAQALIRKPGLIVLDNFFASLEEVLAIQILDSLRADHQSVIFSSFRVKELEKSDRVIFIKGPDDVLIDAHQALWRRDEGYRSLVNGRTPEVL